MSQSLFRLSINTARSIKITSNSSFCECLSCLLLKHCFQFRKICPFFFTFVFVVAFFAHFKWFCGYSVSTSTSTAIEHSSLRNPLDYIVGAPWGAKLNFQLLYVVVVCVRRMEAYVSPRTLGWLFTYVFCTCLSILRLTHRNLFYVLWYIATRLPLFSPIFAEIKQIILIPKVSDYWRI